MENKKYTVGYDQRTIRSICFGIGVVLVSLIYILYHAIVEDIQYREYVIVILISFMGLYGLILYFMMRPRILVDHDILEYYPRWEKKQIVTIQQIQDCKRERGNDFSFFVERKKYSSIFTMIYYSEGKEVLRTTTALPNAKRLDETICQHLEKLGEG